MMDLDIRTLRILAVLQNAVEALEQKDGRIEVFSSALGDAESMLNGYCDNGFPYEQKLIAVLDNLYEGLSEDIYLSSCSSETGYEVNESLFQDADNEELKRRYKDDINDLEKLIIRGSEGGAPVSNEERTEWWKMQKQREREEFYRLNGYYEDDEQ